jgi:hypothetical protein
VNWFCYVFEYILQSQKLFITLHTNLRVKIWVSQRSEDGVVVDFDAV